MDSRPFMYLTLCKCKNYYINNNKTFIEKPNTPLTGTIQEVSVSRTVCVWYWHAEGTKTRCRRPSVQSVTELSSVKIGFDKKNKRYMQWKYQLRFCLNIIIVLHFVACVLSSYLFGIENSLSELHALIYCSILMNTIYSPLSISFSLFADFY